MRLPMWLKWVFRSRPTGKLNSVSYWLLALVTACALDLLLVVGWRLADRFGRNANYSDWIESRFPTDLRGEAGDTLVQDVSELINVLQHGDDQATPLFAVEELSKNVASCAPPVSMFDESDIEVYPKCVVYRMAVTTDKSGQSAGDIPLTAAEQAVFRRFAGYITKKYGANKTQDSRHLERSLAETLGFSKSDSDQTDFDLPWIYISSSTGAVAVFPANTEIAYPFNARTRPWWEATFTVAPHLSSKGLRDDDLLTVTYSDILIKRPILIRTYLRRFTIGGPSGAEFVVALDFHRRDEQSPKISRLIGRRLEAAPKSATFGAALVLSLVLFATIRATSERRVESCGFERDPRLSGYGLNPDATVTTQGHRGERRTFSTQAGIGITKILSGAIQYAKVKDEGVEVITTVKKQRGTLRGIETWDAYLIARSSWRLFGLGFESVRRDYIGQLELRYTNEVLPTAEWTDPPGGAFSEEESNVHKNRLPSLLEHYADWCEGDIFEIDPKTGISIPPRVAQIPDWVSAVTNSEELLAFRQRRAYVTLSDARLDDLYSKADVKAVLLSGYFERLLTNNQIDFLLKGRTITRLVSFPDDKATIDLSGCTGETYKQLMNRYSSITSRTIKRVNESIDVAGSEPQPVYDFAILNNQMLVVSQ